MGELVLESNQLVSLLHTCRLFLHLHLLVSEHLLVELRVKVPQSLPLLVLPLLHWNKILNFTGVKSRHRFLVLEQCLRRTLNHIQLFILQRFEKVSRAGKLRLSYYSIQMPVAILTLHHWVLWLQIFLQVVLVRVIEGRHSMLEFRPPLRGGPLPLRFVLRLYWPLANQGLVATCEH